MMSSRSPVRIVLAAFLLTGFWAGDCLGDEALEQLAIEARQAALQLDTRVERGELNGYGVFISEDGLALVPLSGVALPDKPGVRDADGNPLRFGRILGLFPKEEVALMKFKHRPRRWLTIAASEPEVGDTVAHVTLEAYRLLNSEVPPIVGMVLSKRSGLTTMSRIFRFVRLFMVGGPSTVEQRTRSRAGSFTINRDGELVAIMNGSGPVLAVASLVGISDEIRERAEAGEEIPFPLPGELNTNDNALMAGGFGDYHEASLRGDVEAARRHFRHLLERYPDSPSLLAMVAETPNLVPDPLSLLPEPDENDPPGHQVNRLVSRAAVLAIRANSYEAAEESLLRAIELSPEDYVLPHLRLAHLRMFQNDFTAAEPLMRQAYAVQPDDWTTIAVHYQLLTRLGKTEDVAQVVERVRELAAILSLDEREMPIPTAGSPPPAPPVTQARGPDARLIAEVDAAREATLMLTRARAPGMGGTSSFGVFIAEDGLALVSLMALAGDQPPAVDAADGLPVPFGEVLAVFPEYQLALMKFDFQPDAWLELADDEPKIGDRIAMMPLKGARQVGLLNQPIQAVIGPIVEKRSRCTTTLRENRFVEVVAVGAGLTRQQAASLSIGTMAINLAGELVGANHGEIPKSTPAIQTVVPLAALAGRIRELAERGEALPFPLEGDADVVDPVATDPDYDHFSMAQHRGDLDEVERRLRQLVDRYPGSIALWYAARFLPRAGRPGLGIADVPEPDPDATLGQRVSQWEARGSTPNPLPEAEFERAIGDYRRAIELAPEDYPSPRLSLAHLFMTMQRYEDAAGLFREAGMEESFELFYLEQYESALTKLGKFSDALRIARRINEVNSLFRVR